ncbi:hypothetical protein SCUCBS95973_003020 [Sporothrix curviconia]|uniref:Fungal N-terminal domain-containing protein n=1 Tax=Sporothrix curviconia TaxID=1260050 RepID=A0ABP0BBY6_9PEZI
MAFSLINNTVHGQDRIRSLVCANHVAYSFLTGLQSDKSPEMQRELARSKMGYQNNILDALKNLDAMLMQDMGYMRQCWKLNAAACRVGSALKGRSAAELGLQHPEDIVGMKTVCIKSFIYDMAMSANVYQPPCMATMELDRSVLDTTSPCDAMLSVMLTFAEVQEAIVHETRKCVSPGQTHQIDTDKLGALERKMQGVRAQVEEFRARPESSSDDYLRFEWLSIDLNFYSMMTTITRLGSVGDDPHAHMKCLENARRCLFTLKAMLAQFAQVTSPDRYLSSLAW